MQASDHSVQRPGHGHAGTAGDLRLPLNRDTTRLPWRSAPAAPGDALSADEVVAFARAADDRQGAWLVGGGDPLARGDIAELLRILAALRPANLGLCTAGAGLGVDAVRRLRALGVARVCVPIHSARQDAHDWLVGRPGALKTALRAVRACVEAGMPVATEVVLTRPTAPHLAETIGLLARVGVRTVCVRRLTAHDLEPAAFVPLSPRLSLLAADLERAATVALGRGLRLSIRDVPVCAAPRLRPLFARPGTEAWVTARGVLATRGEDAVGCARCVGSPACAGVPLDYVARFGWEEFAEAEPAALRVGESVATQQAPRRSDAMALSWRGPRRVRCDACADHPGEGWGGPPESTRAIRARLVEAARYRPAVLRLVGADVLAHPAAALLLFDAVRLFPRVECAGEASAIAGWSDLDIRRLKDLQRIDVALYGPDAGRHDGHCGIPGAFAATMRGVERLRALTPVAVGAYAVVHDARSIPLFADAWGRGELPGEPRFRLAAHGGSLDDVLACARAMAPGPARSALAAVLPRCAGARHAAADDGPRTEPRSWITVAAGRRTDHVPSGSDPTGTFTNCRDDGEPCAVAGCPGAAAGWQRPTRVEQWTADV
jgi:MoaA/NifB/PqqE/SkfB family radical SAM enzyme